jgi:hypothetical protein
MYQRGSLPSLPTDHSHSKLQPIRQRRERVAGGPANRAAILPMCIIHLHPRPPFSIVTRSLTNRVPSPHRSRSRRHIIWGFLSFHLQPHCWFNIVGLRRSICQEITRLVPCLERQVPTYQIGNSAVWYFQWQRNEYIHTSSCTCRVHRHPESMPRIRQDPPPPNSQRRHQ